MDYQKTGGQPKSATTAMKPLLRQIPGAQSRVSGKSLATWSRYSKAVAAAMPFNSGSHTNRKGTAQVQQSQII
jgi:hypothetical protein